MRKLTSSSGNIRLSCWNTERKYGEQDGLIFVDGWNILFIPALVDYHIFSNFNHENTLLSGSQQRSWLFLPCTFTRGDHKCLYKNIDPKVSTSFTRCTIFGKEVLTACLFHAACGGQETCIVVADKLHIYITFIYMDVRYTRARGFRERHGWNRCVTQFV